MDMCNSILKDEILSFTTGSVLQGERDSPSALFITLIESCLKLNVSKKKNCLFSRSTVQGRNNMIYSNVLQRGGVLERHLNITDGYYFCYSTKDFHILCNTGLLIRKPSNFQPTVE